jgi:hypothetical protein
MQECKECEKYIYTEKMSKEKHPMRGSNPRPHD